MTFSQRLKSWAFLLHEPANAVLRQLLSTDKKRVAYFDMLLMEKFL
ncbi:hypothetical protein H0O03_01960 [Candidatus Micrarchaeota archaeon]|nr:hypothetical protein [Candidatus Micrarchaeota archaeon]